MPTATATLDTIGTSIVNTGTSMAETVFTTYWPYVLVVGIIIGLVIIMKRLVRSGH